MLIHPTIWAVVFLANHLNFQITSLIRSPEENARVGGIPNSLHLTGRAVDIVAPDDESKSILRLISMAFKLDYVDEGDHIHLEYDRD